VDGIGGTRDAAQGGHAHSHMLETYEPSVVVTTTSSHLETNTTSDEDDLRTRPRGFFADQFEVCSQTLI
jgi:hypothetical protein